MESIMLFTDMTAQLRDSNLGQLRKKLEYYLCDIILFSTYCHEWTYILLAIFASHNS